MSSRETLRQLDSEGIADLPASPANSLRDLIYKIAESVTISLEEAIADVAEIDADEFAYARAVALNELSEALDSYGAVAAYPELLAAAKDATVALAAHGEKAIVYRLARARTLSEKSLVGDGIGEPSVQAATVDGPSVLKRVPGSGLFRRGGEVDIPW